MSGPPPPPSGDPNDPDNPPNPPGPAGGPPGWPSQPPQQQPPYYGHPGPGQPPQQSSSNTTVGVLVGALVIGPIVGVAAALLAIVILVSLEVDDGTVYFVGAVLLPILVPVPLLFFPKTRPWGVGIMIGAALTSIVLAGACASIIGSYE